MGKEVLVEQSVGGDEIDCVANISGELTLFELKDKEFNLGNDAKEHFTRARQAGKSRRDPYTSRAG